MSGQVMAVAFFCLATGAALGCLFLLFRGISLLLGLGRLATGLFDAVFCCLCGGIVFLCALAVDNGHLRLYQAVLQGLGAWCVVVALGPWVRKGSQALKKFLGRFGPFWWEEQASCGGFFQQERPPRDNRGKKLEKRRKNREKRLENFMYTGL